MAKLSEKIAAERKQNAKNLIERWEALRGLNMQHAEIAEKAGVEHTFFFRIRRTQTCRSDTTARVLPLLDKLLEKLSGKKSTKSHDAVDAAIAAPKKKIRVVSSAMTMKQFEAIHQNLVKAARDLTDARERYERLRNQLLTVEI